MVRWYKSPVRRYDGTKRRYDGTKGRYKKPGQKAVSASCKIIHINRVFVLLLHVKVNVFCRMLQGRTEDFVIEGAERSSIVAKYGRDSAHLECQERDVLGEAGSVLPRENF